MRKSTTATLWLSILVLLCASSVSVGQGTTSRVTGTVSDEKGAVVPGAIATLTSEAIQSTRPTDFLWIKSGVGLDSLGLPSAMNP